MGSENGAICGPCVGGSQHCESYVNYKECHVKTMIGKVCHTNIMMVQCDGPGSYNDWDESC